ncbi:hypothetical protein PVAG01_07374 [Phlyctema vagabunda]|uniref:Apple domain-containing protein n=1 Tax=Phlyctema vagabunda TaxID=108571 RepID=A0ABR4PCD7_9HELO
MRVKQITGLAVAYATYATALALPQDIEFDLVDATPDPPTPVISIGATAQVITYNAPSLIAEVVSDVLEGGAVVPEDVVTKRAQGDCAVQPTGLGENSSPDTADAFLADPKYNGIADIATTPAGYTRTFSKFQASNNAFGYMGYDTLQSYDTVECAKRCTNKRGCNAFNIYFERDPTLDPGPTCSDPASTINIKCVFWGGPVTPQNAVNTGETRNAFRVVISGSNGYVSEALNTPAGYGASVYLGDAAINAPLDDCGVNTYMGVKLFNQGQFDIALCASACTAQSEYNLRHPPKEGKAKTCQYFNTYILYKNDVAQGQYCSLYSESWDRSYAVNRGQYRGSDKYTISYSFSVSNATNPNPPPTSCPAL